jgi:hypothetical protein
MATLQEQIVAYAAALLTGIDGVGNRIYRSRQEAYSRDESPSISVEPGTATTATEPVSTCKIDWTLQLLIAVFSRGTVPPSGTPLLGLSADQAADPVIQAVHSRMMADRGMGGLAMDCWLLSRDPQLVSAEDPSMVTVLTYQVRYRTSIADLSTGAP